MTGRVRAAVIGVGYLGQYHAEKYAALAQAELVAVCDVDQVRCQQLAQVLGVTAVFDYRELIGKIDAVSIVAPTSLHHTIGQFFLSHGVHVLMEKPITTTLAEADDLIAIAHKNQAILQVGHLERFNPAMMAIVPLVNDPWLIQATRLAPFKTRGSDVSVILDLMIHDIDLIQSLVPANITRISATGASTVTTDIDIAQAYIEFNNGCITHLTASRVNPTSQRQLAIFQADRHIRADFAAKTVSIQPRGSMVSDTQMLAAGDALKDEIAASLITSR